MVAERRPWRRVSRRERCPICDDHDSACLIFENGDVLCAHVISDEPVDHFLGLCYRHRAGDTARPSAWSARIPAPSTPQTESADAATKHVIYTRLLELCPPVLADRDYLLSKAGHTDAMVDGNYGSLPSPDNQKAVIATLSEEFGAETLATVPGIVTTNGHQRWNGAGLLIAHRDRQGRIQALQVRVSLSDGGKVYRWLSSTKVGGPSSGAPAHVARPPVVRDHRIYVCESGKTATYLAHTLGATVVALAGLSNHGPALQVLAALAKQEDAEVAVLLLDAVDPSDPAAARKEALTEQQRQALAAAVSRLGYHVKIGRWSHADGKGPDDVLIGGHTFQRERYTLPTDESGRGASLLAHVTDDGAVNVDPRFLVKLMSETAAALTLRARYQRVQAILADPIMNDGQKLVTIALASRFSRPHAHGEPVEPVKVCAETIARELGSKVTIKDGKERPTKLGTVTKNLADIATLGVCTREEVRENRVVTLKDDRGHKYQKDVTVTTFRYHDTLSLPGERIKREDAKDIPTRAKADRERPRCPRCFSTKLRPSTHICLDCQLTSSDVEATEAGQVIANRGNGQFVHRLTGEEIVPGVPVYNSDFAVASAPNDTECWNPVSGQTSPTPVTYDSYGPDPIPESGYFSTPEQEYRIPVLGQAGNTGGDKATSQSAATSVVLTKVPTKPCAGGCGALTPYGWECKACRMGPASLLHIQDSAVTGPEAPAWI